VSSRQSRVSVSSVIAIASIMLFGPTAGVLTHMVSGMMSVVTTTLLSKLPEAGRASWFRRTFFNVGMLVIAASAAGRLYGFSGGNYGTVNQISNIFPLVVMVTMDTLANIAILVVVIALQTDKSPFQIWRQDFQWAAPIAILGGIIGGGALALAYDLFKVLGLAVFLFPIIATSYSYRLYANNMRDYVNKLEAANINLENMNLELLETMGAIIDAYDVYTYGHSTQVAVYAGAIADEMELANSQKSIIVKAALVHDIGKVGVMDSIIGKPDSLTDDEYNLMKRHPDIGAEILSQMEGFLDLIPLVRYHHERWDGRGYPDGLAQEAIPQGARVLAVADTLDAMLSDRPYRPTKSLSKVLHVIKNEAGKQFDPNVVAALRAVTGKKKRGFFKNSAASVDQSLRTRGVFAPGLDRRYLKKSMIANPRSEIK
jgi:putative nucleotidyltransferase with HDIG domain